MSQLDIINELVEAYLNGNEETLYVYNRLTKEIIMESTATPSESELDTLIVIPQMTSSEAHDLMVLFADKQETTISQQLLDVLKGKQPFQSFKEQIKGQGIENEWYDFEGEYAKEKMADWVKMYT